nr:MAG TPA: hypothetical protein [Caudoviricetes sp.]
MCFNILRIIYILNCLLVKREIWIILFTKFRVYKRTNSCIISMRAIYNISFKSICLFWYPC